jgi:DNA-binding transcriptional ArsR family regulator
MKDPLRPDHCASLLRALADPIRLRIVDALGRGKSNVTELADRLGLTVVLLSHHLAVLRYAGIVEAQRHGRKVVYRLRSGVYESGARPGRFSLDLGCCRLEWPTVLGDRGV